MSRFRFESTQAADEAELRKRMAEDWLPGNITVSFRREPDYFAGCPLQARNMQVFKCLDTERGAAIPVYWLPLNKRGNSNSRERIALLKRFIDQFGRDHIKGLLADREFIGDQWLGWLLEQKIPFTIRIRNNCYTTNAQGEQIRVDQLFYTLEPGEERIIRNARKLGRHRVHISGLRLSDGELMIVVSDHFEPQAIQIDGLRWEIETLLGCLKGCGFKLEETRVTGYLGIKKLLVLPVIAFCGCHKIGEWKHACILPIKIKTHNRRVQSLFRYGLDAIRSELLNLFTTSRKLLLIMISLLRPPLPDPVCNKPSRSAQ